MKQLFKKGSKIAAIVTVAALCAASLTACSFGKKAVQTSSPAPAVAESTTPTASPEELIIGKWEISGITDSDGKAVNLSDVDLSGTALANYSSIIGMVLKKGASIEFKADKTIPLVITNGEYAIDGNTLSISVPSVSQQAIKSTFEVSDTALKLKISTYTINLTKK